MTLASEQLERDGITPLPDGVTPHALRRTFTSLLVTCGLDPNAHPMRLDGDARERLRALVEGVGLAPAGTRTADVLDEDLARLTAPRPGSPL